MHTWVMTVSNWVHIFLSDLNVGACIFQENEPIVTYNKIFKAHRISNNIVLNLPTGSKIKKVMLNKIFVF